MKLNMTPQKYEYILKNVIFNEYKNEKEVFDLLIRGHTNISISDKTGLSLRTVCRRKKEILKKISHLM